MDLTKVPPPDSLPPPRLPVGQMANASADAALSAALLAAAAAPADPVHIHPLDLSGAMQIMIAEVRVAVPLPGDVAPLQPIVTPAPGGAPPPQTMVQLFLQALPPPEAFEPAAWLAAATEAEGRVQVALDRAVQATAAWRDVPTAVVAGAKEIRDLVVAAITDDPPNPLWLRPEWLGLAPRMERYWRRRRRARRWLSDPDLHWRERDEHGDDSGKDGG